ncbi:I78 family peptidase inhibitor [Sphingosinicella rhizophila]|uniref:I78 family peptidase inhibitor n=1 Tax=Sphingosinicella rhizophila TaxID=3050082 RepID=A0ABU3Q452_9SPHN|nr:I78 family peptidase inhibitor [Sphingosinicella sp. GR2756]MDT9597715.1 I78 family peptidase inhibitor [Sphingosinicella sp. GR2756]
MKALVGLAMLATSACASSVAEGHKETAPGGNGRKCHAQEAQPLLGRDASTALGAEAMRLSQAERLRWIPEGAAVTMDYRETRLNIQLDRQNKVVKIYCG